MLFFNTIPNIPLRKTYRHFWDSVHSPKWGGIPTGITQNVKDLLISMEVENIFEKLYCKGQMSSLLLKQYGSQPIRSRMKRPSREGGNLSKHAHRAFVYPLSLLKLTGRGNILCCNSNRNGSRKGAKMSKIIYTQVGDYLLPNITLSETQEAKPLAKYGMMRKRY